MSQLNSLIIIIELDQKNVEGLCGLAQIYEDKNKLDD